MRFQVVLLLLAIGTPSSLLLAIQNQKPKQDCQPAITVRHWQSQAQILKSTNFNFQIAGTGKAAFNNGNLELSLGPTETEGYITACIHEVDLNLTGEDRDSQKCWKPAEGTVEIEYRIKWATVDFNMALTESAFLVNAPESIMGPWTVVGIVRSPLTQGYSVVVGQSVVPSPSGLDGFFAIEPLSNIDPTQWHTVKLRVHGNQAEITVIQDSLVVEIMKEVPEPFEPLGMAFSIDNEGIPGTITPPTQGSSLFIDYYHARQK